MKKQMIFSLALILGISIGHFSKKSTTDVHTIRQYPPEYSFNKNSFKETIWDVNNYEEHRFLGNYSNTQLETIIYEIQEKKEMKLFKSRILIQFCMDSVTLESMKIQEMVESKFENLDIVYLYKNEEVVEQGMKIGLIY